MKKAKRILTLLMTAAMMMSMLAGCGGTSEEGDQADAGAETRDDLVVATNNASVSLIPWDNLSYFDYYVTENIYDSLMFSDATFVELEPRLAERYELSEDGLSMTLYLRSDATFHDGETIGYTEDQFLPVTRSAGVWHNGMTRKIPYPGES